MGIGLASALFPTLNRAGISADGLSKQCTRKAQGFPHFTQFIRCHYRGLLHWQPHTLECQFTLTLRCLGGDAFC